MLFVLLQREESCSQLVQGQALRSVGGLLNGLDEIQGEAFHMSPSKDDSMRYFTFYVIGSLQLFLFNYSLD